MTTVFKRVLKTATYGMFLASAFLVSFFVSGSKAGGLSSSLGADRAYADAPPAPGSYAGSYGSAGSSSGYMDSDSDSDSDSDAGGGGHK